MSKRPGEELNSAVQKQTALQTVPAPAMEQDAPSMISFDQAGSTVEYPMIGPQQAPMIPLDPNDPLAVDPNYRPIAFPNVLDLAARRNYEMQVAAARAAAIAAGQQQGFGPVTTVLAPRRGGVFLRGRPLEIESDPLVRQLATQTADVENKITSLLPTLTQKQRLRIQARMRNIKTVVKGKHRGTAKIPTADQLQKVLFQTLELHASRRAAQLGAQARRARRERHALMQHKRGVDLPDGTTVGLNKRHYKKLATNAIQKAADAQAQAEKKALRVTLTNNNKQARVAVATAHGRKVNPKDRIPATQ